VQHAHVHDKHRGPLSRGEKPSGSRWEVWWTEPDSGTGKTVTRRKRFAKKVHAQAHADALNEKFREGVAAPTLDGSKTVVEVSAHWMAQRHGIKSSVRYRSAGALRTWVLPRFRARAVGSIKRSEVQDFANDLLAGTAVPDYSEGTERAAGPLAPASVRVVLTQLRGTIEHARLNEWMSGANPVFKIALPKTADDEMVFLNFQQVERLVSVVGDRNYGQRYAATVQVMAYCGLRIGEVLTLKVSDVDLLKRRIHVQRSWISADTWTMGLPKNGKKRFVPISTRLVEVLRPFVAAGDGYLFPSPRGVAEQPDNWRNRVWKQAIAGSEFAVMKMTPHDLRHTAASMSIAAGADVKVVQNMLGHASAVETLDRYGHLWPDRLDEVADAVEAARKTALGLAT
jgi:integrase